MQTILKVFSVFIGIFVIVNGTWVVVMPPYGDEALALSSLQSGSPYLHSPCMLPGKTRNQKPDTRRKK